VGADGRQFFFRSVDKDPSATLPPELRGTVAGSVVRDQVSSAFPTAPLVVAKLLTAAGILHGNTRLVVLPHDPILGEFEAEFGGMMGFLEDRVGGTKDPAAHWGGASEIIASDSLFARTARSPEDRVDARALLTARLFDVFIGDWDRHADQWRWARFGDSVPRRWVPIPLDRDQAFVKYDGLLLSVARQSVPQLIDFGPKYPYIAGATWNGRDLDRRFLVELDWPTWKSVATDLQTKLTDAVIDDAVRTLPPEHYALRGKTLAANLRQRRDHLLDAAQRYYRVLAKQVDVHATDGEDQAIVTRGSKGEVDVTLAPAGTPAGGPSYFERRFDPQSTKEVRVFLDGGDDLAVVRGNGGGPTVRIIGGDGHDRLVDSSRSGGNRFYDDPQAPSRTEGRSAGVNRRPYSPPRKNPKDLPPRDWGKRWTPTTWVTYHSELGLFVGGGRTLTIYGFRKNPYAIRHRFRAGIATGPSSYRVDYRGDFRRENSTIAFGALLRASGLDVISFYGFGNEVAAPQSRKFYRVTQNAFSAYPFVSFGLGGKTALETGPFLKYASTDNRPDRFLATLGNLYGSGKFGEVGAGIHLRHDSRNRPNGATKGVVLDLAGNVYPPIWNVDSTYGEVHGEASTYLTAHAPLDPTLALRVGGKKIWGRYPYFDAAFIGGASNVRLGKVNRYAGDASAYGSAELRLTVTPMEIILPGDFGIFGLADGGRVFLQGESSDRWHTAYGGGVWFSWLDRAYSISLAIAKGEERTGLYIQGGFGF
jgi:hypothetical protein